MTGFFQLLIAVALVAIGWLVVRSAGRTWRRWSIHRAHARHSVGFRRHGLALRGYEAARDRDSLHRNFGLPPSNARRFQGVTYGKSPGADALDAVAEFRAAGRPFAEMAGAGCDWPECP